MSKAHGWDDLVGELVEERYLIEAKVGRGAMGMVYRARHVRVGREVAIKVLHDHLVRDSVMVQRFEREAAIAARLTHRNVIAVIDVGETRFGQRLMVQELARGESLAAILAKGRLERDRIVNLVEQLLRGLEHAHAAGLVHRDLKPENVIVERDDHCAEVPRIVDFGIAVLREGVEAPPDAPEIHRLTAAGVVLGTPPYMAPEQAYALDPDPRTDLFALGVMVYEMLSGRHPFEGTSMEIVIANATQDPPPICRRAPGVDADPLLEAFARKLMARKLRDRFASARDALEALALIGRLHRDRGIADRLLDPRSPTEPHAVVAPGAASKAAPVLEGKTLDVDVIACAHGIAPTRDSDVVRSRAPSNHGRRRRHSSQSRHGHGHAGLATVRGPESHVPFVHAPTVDRHAPRAFASGSVAGHRVVVRAPQPSRTPGTRTALRTTLSLVAAAVLILVMGMGLGWWLVTDAQALPAPAAPSR